MVFDRVAALIFLSAVFLFFGWLLLPYMGYDWIKYRQIFYKDTSRLVYKDGKIQIGSIYKIQTLNPDTKRPIGGKLGKFIRMIGLDEFPQLILVLQGRWSIFGPRSIMNKERMFPNGKRVKIIDSAERYYGRKPGFLSSVVALKGRGPGCPEIETWAAYDRFDTNNWSITLALRILLRTILLFLWVEGVEEYEVPVEDEAGEEQREHKTQGDEIAPYRPRRLGLYTPAIIDSRYARETEITIYHHDGTVETQPHKEYIGPLHRDVDDYVSAEQRHRILERASLNKKQHVVVGLSTFNSASYIRGSLLELLPELVEIKEKYSDWDVELVIGVNGVNQEETVQQIREYQEMFSDPRVRITMIYVPFQGKVQAMNLIAQHAINNDSTVLTFVDDDLSYLRGTILSGIEKLILSGDLSYVGSIIEPFEPETLWDRITNRARALYKSAVPLGPHMVLFTQTYPMIPSYLRVEDTFLACYFIDVEHDDPMHRMIISEKGLIRTGYPKSLIAHVKKATRSEYTRAQLRYLLPREINAYKQTQENRVVQPLLRGFRDTDIRDHIPRVFAVLFYYGIRFVVRRVVKFELVIRKLVGKPRRTIHWRSDPNTKLTFEERGAEVVSADHSDVQTVLERVHARQVTADTSI